VVVVTVGIVVAFAGTASAHPLGNFTTNHYAEVVLSGDRAFVVYVLDLAEIPTFQSRSAVETRGRARYAAGLEARIKAALDVAIDGRRRTLVLR
jgi:hypothetical protein